MVELSIPLTILSLRERLDRRKCSNSFGSLRKQSSGAVSAIIQTKECSTKAIIMYIEHYAQPLVPHFGVPF